MRTSKTEIINSLKKQMLNIQGFKSGTDGRAIDFGLGVMTRAFPNQVFPTGVIHEFLGTNLEDAAATGGFISALLAILMKETGICIWISTQRKIFPPSLASFGLDPDRIIFIDLHREKDVLWATEEALKCDSLSAVITEIDEITFAQSRRLQLVTECSRVTSFIIRKNESKLNATQAVARWQITAIASESIEGLPGIGHPRWKIQLLKVKNGLPGAWKFEFAAGQFIEIKEVQTNDETIKQAV